ncbi:MAG: hypothetical protein E7058_08365 [Lentisphaerae bacterium]|nr:hypothetical protein [Lentisphaerota bacterium]
MVIKKLNNLFHKHSRILFGAFTVLIILAFTDFLTPGNISGCDSAANTPVGIAFGEKVTADELQKTYRDMSIYFMITRGGEVNFDAKMIFYQYCQIKRAEQLGIVVSDEEIAEEIRKSPLFSKENSVKTAYSKFLKDRNLNSADVNEAMRQNMKIEKMLNTLTDSVVVSDAEVKAAFENMEQKREFATCVFKYDSFKVADPSAKELAEYFSKNQEKYMTAGSIKTVSAVVPYAKYKDSAAKKVTAEMIAAVKKQFPGGMADADVRTMLEKQIASGEAQKEAFALYQEVSGKVNAALPAAKQIAAFRSWAEGKALEIVEQDNAYSQSNVSMQQMPLTGSRLIKDLQPAENGVMITVLKDREAPKKQAITAVRKQLIEDYKLSVQRTKAREAAEAEVKKLNALKGDARINAFKALKGEHNKENFPEMSFSMAAGFYAQMGMVGQLYQMYSEVFGMNIGDISPVVSDENGVKVFIVVSRTAADEKEFSKTEKFYAEMVKNMKAQNVLQTFFEDLQRQCQFTMADGKDGEKSGEQAK